MERRPECSTSIKSDRGGSNEILSIGNAVTKDLRNFENSRRIEQRVTTVIGSNRGGSNEILSIKNAVTKDLRKFENSRRIRVEHRVTTVIGV
jgi:hypothetical protein